jgi:NAD-dependent DNA ligase
MKPFLELFEQLPDSLQDRLITDNQSSTVEMDDKFSGKTFVFSGPRNKEWETLIINGGGKIGSSVSSKTFAVITTTEEIEKSTNSKIVLAKSLPNCKLWSWEQFDKFINN